MHSLQRFTIHLILSYQQVCYHFHFNLKTCFRIGYFPRVVFYYFTFINYFSTAVFFGSNLIKTVFTLVYHLDCFKER